MYVIANVSPQDLVVLFVVALVVFGPKRLPEVGRQVGHAMRDLKKLSAEFTGALMGVQEEVRATISPVISSTMDRGAQLIDRRPTTASFTEGVGVVESDPKASRTEFGVESPRSRRGVTLSTLPPEVEGEP